MWCAHCADAVRDLAWALVLVGGVVLATGGTIALTYVLFDPDAREKMKDCADKFRACKRKKPSDDTEVGDMETA